MTTHAYQHLKLNSNDDDRADLCSDVPLADEEWTVKYQEVDDDKELEPALKELFDLIYGPSAKRGLLGIILNKSDSLGGEMIVSRQIFYCALQVRLFVGCVLEICVLQVRV